MEGELGSPTGKPCIFFGTTPSLVVAYVLAMSVWYPVEQGSDAEEEPRSSAALDWGDGQASLHFVHHHRPILFLDEASAPARQ